MMATDQSVAIQITGEVQTSARVNLRQGAPNTQAPVLRKLPAGTRLPVQAVVAGESVQGNPHWYLTNENAYVWAGGCGPFQTGLAGPQVAAAPLLSAPSLLDAPVARVVDISHGDGVTSFLAARNSGVLGVIHKATTGATGKDDAYSTRRTQATAAGLLWGAYHWGTAAPVADQVTNFLGWATPDDNTLVALDYEATLGNQMTLDMARAFLQAISDQLHRKAVLYSGGLIKGELGQTKDDFLGGHRLWLAQYGPAPVVQASWTTYWLWQYTDGESGPNPKFVPGIPGDSKGRVDCDYFAGSAQDLAAQWAS
jgi:GH25 family lysozyme M1 (1,4-beta-N-acetylmuramidase)